MTNALLSSLETLLTVKRQRLAVTHSPRSREVLKREIRLLVLQIESMRLQRTP